MDRHRTRARLVALLAALALLAVACGGSGGSGGGDDGGGSGELLADTYDFSGLNVRVGTKDFTEMLLLGEITRIALEETGATVEYTPNLPSPAGAREALMADQIDVTWEYSGTTWINYLGHDVAPEGVPPEEFWEMVAQEDLEENGIYWAPPASFDDTYGIAYRADAAQDLGIEKISDFPEFIEQRPEDATLCMDPTFGTRNDGLPGLEEEYGFTWPRDQTTQMDFGVIYTSTRKGKPCNFGEVFTTDGRIAAFDLKLVEDDQNFFLSYLTSLTMKQEFNEQNPDIGEMFGIIGEPLDQKTMTDMNAEVDVDGKLEEQVATEYLQEQGFIE